MSSPARTPRVIPVVVVVPPRVLLVDIAGPLEVLRKANLVQADVRFDVCFVGPAPDCESSIGLTLSGIGSLPPILSAGALILVPGSADIPASGPQRSRPDDSAAEGAIVDWLSSTVRSGMRLVSICSGALLAARAGLLDGHDCTTHHGAIAELVRAAPAARVLENRIFVESGERMTSAGVTAGIDLMLHIVAQETGHGTALAAARHMVVYMRRAGADPQLSPWLEGRNHMHAAIHKAQDAVISDPGRPWSVAALASIAGASPRNLSRLFNEQTGMTVTDFLNRMRIALAHELVTTSRMDMEQVAEKAGFGSARQFRRAWNRLHAIPPSRLRRDRAGR